MQIAAYKSMLVQMQMQILVQIKLKYNILSSLHLYTN